MELEGIDHVAVGVRDIEQSAKWYIEVLGFERLHEGMWNGIPTFVGKGLMFEDLGEVDLKGFGSPVRAHAAAWRQAN